MNIQIKTYGLQKAVNNASLDIKTGGALGSLGHNRAEKCAPLKNDHRLFRYRKERLPNQKKKSN